LRILRAFLARAAATSPNLADLRAVLTSIFSAYAYEESILQLSNRLLEQQLFVNVKQAVELRQRGWRPKGSTCEACGRRVWGPGVAGNVFEAWEEKQAIENARRAEKSIAAAAATESSSSRGKGKAETPQEPEAPSGKGKGKSTEPGSQQDPSSDAASPDEDINEESRADKNGNAANTRNNQPLGPLVVLACRHIYHQSCLDALQEQREGEKHRTVDEFGREKEYRCPIDG
jgi:hypothetical protein